MFLTETGMMMGTVQYMSPEQALGQELDHRTDLFSLGAVLYEMAAGTTAFKGNTTAALCNAILHGTPASPRQSNRDLPEELERIITKALEKDREIRYQTASDLRADLKRLQRNTESKQATIPGPVQRSTPQRVRRWKRLALASTITVLLFGLGLGWYTWRRERPQPDLKQRQLTTNSSETPVTATAISPDGKYLACADETGIFLKRIDTAERHPLSTPAVSRMIFNLNWFPDGTKLLVSGANRPGTDEGMAGMWALSILGGPPRKLRENGKYASVSPDGSQIAFLSDKGKEIWLMGATGEEARRIMTTAPTDFFLGLTWFPRGERLGYSRGHVGTDRIEAFLESCNLTGQQVSTAVSLTRSPSTSAWFTGIWPLPEGHIIYSIIDYTKNEASVWEIGLDVRTGKPGGKPRQITSWPGFRVDGLSASADGKRLALLKSTSQWDVYVGELEESGTGMKPPRRLTFDERNDFPAAWTPDSKAVLFSSDRNGNMDIFKQALDQRSAEPIVAGPSEECDPVVSPDGAWILYFGLTGGQRLYSADPVSLRRAPLSGGPSELVLNERGFALSIVHALLRISVS